MNAKQIITETLMRIEGDPDRKLFDGYAETILQDLQDAGMTITVKPHVVSTGRWQFNGPNRS